MGYKEEALDLLGITAWHKAGYKGKGIQIVSDELVIAKGNEYVIAPLGYHTKLGHGDSVLNHIRMVAPEATLISFPFSGIFKSNTYDCKCAEYIKENHCHIFTTSYLSGAINTGKEKAIQDCINAGCIFFAAAGNKSSTIHGEARSEKYYAIGGVKPYSTNGKYNWDKITKVPYSGTGKELDFVTLAEILGNSGTSFCSPVIAGMCALVQQFFTEKIGRRLTRTEMEHFMKANCIDLDAEGFDKNTGYGLFVLPDPDTIKISDYISEIHEGIDYSGFPQVGGDNMEIQEMLLTPSIYTRPLTKITPTAIAWHYVGNPNTSAIANRNYFENLSKNHTNKASSHYIIGLEGEILHLIPDDEMSFCTNEANSYTISVECCHPDETGKFNDKTYKSMVWLGRYLMAKHGITKNIRHYDVTKKCCPKWFVDNPKEWEKFKKELEAVEVRYKTVEEMPEWARQPIQELIDMGALSGRGGSAGLDLSDDMVRMLIIAKKIYETPTSKCKACGIEQYTAQHTCENGVCNL